MAKKLTQEEFIEKAKAVHGASYDYGSTEYTTAKAKVVIICPTHGRFIQRPDHHINGAGCPKCAAEKISKQKQKTLKDFLAKANKVHKTKYDYSGTDYISALTPVKIICRIHGEFTQLQSVHLSGCGCSKCGDISIGTKLRSNTDEFVDKAVRVHKDKYDYTKTKYLTSKDKVVIVCEKHGEFLQSPEKHLAGNGCPECANALKGWNYSSWEEQGKEAKNFVDYRLYVVRMWNETESFIKIGKTFNSYSERFSNTAKFYKYEVLYEVIADARTVSELESKYLSENRDNKYAPVHNFGGQYECFTKVELKDRGLSYGC